MTDANPQTLHACPICGLQQTVDVVPSGARVHCARCDHLLFQDLAGEANRRVFCFALTALLLLIPANLYPIREVTSFGNTRSYTALSGARALWDGSMWPLALPVGLFSVVLPFCLIIALLSLATAESSGLPATTTRFLRRAAEFLSVWSIVDVYCDSRGHPRIRGNTPRDKTFGTGK